MPQKKSAKATNGLKHTLEDEEHSVPLKVLDERPAKKAKLLDDSDSDSDNDIDGEDSGHVSLKVNEEYARRFEYNKKRAEKHRLEEKYGKDAASESDSEADVEEDDAGELATEALDAEIFATLNAIRSKDPRVYDKNVNFYQAIDEDITNAPTAKEKEKAMTLKQFHTKNLLEGKFDGEEEDMPPKSYAQEREEDRQEALKQINAQADSDDEEGDFLVAKSKPAPSEKRVKITEQDVVNADKDPDTFLSNFMASRAWVPTGESHWAPLESDDEDEDARADEYESAYNMYFETTEGSNEKIVTYARDAVANTTVRREEKSGRRKAREVARAKREAERKEKEEDLARLRKLKIEEMEGKVDQIRKIGGLKGRDFKMDDWADVLEADWADDQWDEEMRKRFGDAYYDGADDAESDEDEDEDAENTKSKNKKKPKKPKFDDDIDVKDLIPDFVDDDEERPAFTLSSDEENAVEEDEEEASQPSSKKSSKQRKQERADAKSAARRDRRLIENLVDSSLEYEASMATKSKAPTGFRYRETSPTTFGLTARDILLADDARLNEFAGLKKLATFRDPAKKKKDKKALSKKARLRAWRMETFGDEDGPKGGFADDAVAVAAGHDESNRDAEVDIREVDGKKKKKRNRKRGTTAAEA